MIPMRVVLLLCLFAFSTACSNWRAPTRAEVNALKAKIESSTVPSFVSADARAQSAWNIARDIYKDREFRPVWIARGRVLDAKVQQFFQLVGDRSHGLHPEDFGVDALREKPPDLIDFDLHVTYVLARYASVLAFGHVDPGQVDPNWIATPRVIDVKKVLHEAIESDSAALLSGRLAPEHDQYGRLRAALQNASGRQINQIELNLDRWRWLPGDLGRRYVRVNIPSFELEVHDGPQIPLAMRVVVGTNENRTPVFSGTMTYLVFSPYWNIPESIMTKETLPMIENDPNYLARQNIEVVRTSGKHIEILDPADVDWENAARSNIQLRPRPGGRNSLGLVKFMFPNRFSVYLHDTPSDKLFDRLTRDFSHGCIRVERPFELASFVLQDQPQWTAERIRKAMHAEEEKHVRLTQTLPVHILYLTAWVDDEGTVHYEKDIYEYDARQLEITDAGRSHQ